MANTKVSGDLIQDGAISQNHLNENHGITTTDIGEGTALYYTDARVANYLTTNNYATQSYVGTITTNSTNWDTAYSWGDHSLVGYLTTETDPVFVASPAYGITSTNITNWNTAYGWGDHSAAGYLTSFTETDPIYSASSWFSTTNNASNWDTAYSWGDHATQSYATQTYVNTAVANLVDSAPTTLDTLNELAAALGDDPNFATTVTTSIGTKWTQDNTKISNWDTAYSWGNHASAGYLTSFDITTQTDPKYLRSDTSDTMSGTLNVTKAVVGSQFVVDPAGWNSANADQWPYFYWHRDAANGWDEGFIKASSARGFFGKAGWGIHMHSDRAFHIFSSGWTSNFGVDHGGTAIAASSFRAPIFYDSNDTGYYLDPTAGSNSKALMVSGFVGWPNHQWTWSRGAHQDPANSIKIWDQYSNLGGSGNPTTYGTILHITGRSSHEDDQLYFSYDGQILHRNAFYGSDNWSSWNSVATARHSFTNNVDLRAPIFYDSNNTAYRADFTDTGNSIVAAGSYNAQNYNKPALLLNASGTSSSGAALGMQQATTEGWTGIFVDFEPYTGWGLYHDNPNNYFCVTSEGTTGQLRSFTVPSRVSGNRTAYEKIRFDQNNGSILAGGDVTAFSDARSKKNIKNIEQGLEKVKQLRGVTFERIDAQDEYKGRVHMGVVAQELLNVIPEVVNKDQDGMYSVAYGNITALLIEAIKELSNKVEELENKLNGTN